MCTGTSCHRAKVMGAPRASPRQRSLRAAKMAVAIMVRPLVTTTSARVAAHQAEEAAEDRPDQAEEAAEDRPDQAEEAAEDRPDQPDQEPGAAERAEEPEAADRAEPEVADRAEEPEAADRAEEPEAADRAEEPEAAEAVEGAMARGTSWRKRRRHASSSYTPTTRTSMIALSRAGWSLRRRPSSRSCPTRPAWHSTGSHPLRFVSSLMVYCCVTHDLLF